MEKPKMQEAKKIQEQIDSQVQHQEAKAAVMQEQLASVSRNKDMAEQELAKFRVLREGFNIASGVLGQQLVQVQQQESPNPVTVKAFEGAIGRLGDLMTQADVAIAKNEGSFLAFQTMEQQMTAQMQQATARSQMVAQQGAKAVELAARAGVIQTETVEAIETEAGDMPIKSVEDLIQSADEAPEPAEKPITRTKKKTASKRGRGRKKAK
jgi:hypothetical protein